MEKTKQVKYMMVKTNTKFGQSQDSTTDQLQELIGVANLLGLYDASDFIKNHITVNVDKDDLKRKVGTEKR